MATILTEEQTTKKNKRNSIDHMRTYERALPCLNWKSLTKKKQKKKTIRPTTK